MWVSKSKEGAEKTFRKNYFSTIVFYYFTETKEPELGQTPDFIDYKNN